ncbi:MAG: hypothetical protein KFF68_16245 [Desulfosarcina sp.]|nr:hypothetical protein [Desulfosarcina sp.]
MTVSSGGTIEEIDAYEEDPFENLTYNDALILVAVCAVKEKTESDENHIEDAKRISLLAQKDPIFSGLGDTIEPSINSFMNMIGKRTDLVKPLASAASALNSSQKKVAYFWAAEIILADSVLTEKNQRILDKYARLLKIDTIVAQQILAGFTMGR